LRRGMREQKGETGKGDNTPQKAWGKKTFQNFIVIIGKKSNKKVKSNV